MNEGKFFELLSAGPNSHGKFYIGIHTKGGVIPPGFSSLVDDVSNNLVDDVGNELIAQD